jgi:hypothetical protein
MPDENWLPADHANRGESRGKEFENQVEGFRSTVSDRFSFPLVFALISVIRGPTELLSLSRIHSEPAPLITQISANFRGEKAGASRFVLVHC